MSNFNNRAQAPSHALKDSKVKLVGDAHDRAIVKNGAPQPPTLAWDFKDNQPRAIVYTNVEGDKQNGKIEAAMDSVTFHAIMDTIRTYANGGLVDGKSLVGIQCKGHQWTSQGRNKNISVLATFWVGVVEGVVTVSITAGDPSRPKVKFKLFPGEYHGFVDAQGNDLTPTEVSRRYATGYANMIQTFMGQLLVANHKSWQEISEGRNKNGQQQNNNGNRNSGFNRDNNQRSGSSGHSEPAADYEDDIPF